MSGTPPFRLASWLCLALLPLRAAGAVDAITLSAGDLAGEQWRIPSAMATLDLAGATPALAVEVPAVLADGRKEPLLRDLELGCADVTLNAQYLVCRQGRARLSLPPAKQALETSVSLVYRRSDGRWRATGTLAMGAGSVSWQARAEDGGLSVNIDSRKLPVSALTPWLPKLPGTLASLSGQLDRLEAGISLPEQGPVSIQGSLSGADLGFDTTDGTVAAAGVAVRLEGRWSGGAGGWRASARGALQQGEFLAGSFYTRLGGEPLAFDMTVDGDADALNVESTTLNDPDSLSLTASGRWRFGDGMPLRDLVLRADALSFPGFYADYLQPVLAQYGFGGLDVSGGMAGALEWHDGAPVSADITLRHVGIDDKRGRLELSGLNGELHWAAEGAPRTTHLSWDRGLIYRIPVGAFALEAESVGDSLKLSAPARLPVLDGALVINDLDVRNWLGEGSSLLFDARLEPLSLTRLSKVLQWPELAGTLSGRIPELTYAGGVYRLGGSLTVNAFDGSLRVSNLRMERPFGVLPKLVADVELSDLDLEKLTGTFSFGRILGRLGGHLRDLRLLDWQPVHFEAAFMTPPDDHSRHRISQRAVDTLTSLGGGGASGALSRSFLRVFDDFGYKRLGISCALDNNVAQMGGVAPAPNGGYYLVEGSGLPRVDVIGHVRRVDWPLLIRQLLEATRTGGPTVGGQAPGLNR